MHTVGIQEARTENFDKIRGLLMEFKDILVHIDNSQQCAARLKLAIMLAREHKAHLTGLYVISQPHFAPQGKALELKVQQAKELFRSITAGAEIPAEFLRVDWGVTGDSTVEILNYYAQRKDLIIVGQSDRKRPQENVPADLPEWVVLGSGRPVLVVPYTGTFGSIGERVLVAWKSGRASSRALHDAMPFLLKAKQVFVVTVTSSADQHRSDRDDGIRAHLERHNIRVQEENLETGDVPVGSVLMNYAWEHGCDLLVMGIYAQTPHGSLAVGPVTKDLFEHMTVPVLMSH